MAQFAAVAEAPAEQSAVGDDARADSGVPVDVDQVRHAGVRAVTVPLVLHGASGLPEDMVHQAIRLGVRKFNVNTEVREAYINALRQDLQQSQSPDLTVLMQHAEAAMQVVVTDKIYLFGSVDKA